MRRLVYLLPLALFIVLAGYFVISLRPNHDIHELPSAMIEKPAPAFDLAGLDSTKSLDLNALKGHPLVINFFASWCVPCRIEHPLLMRLAEQNHLPLYGIATRRNPPTRHASWRPLATPTGRSVSTRMAVSG
jgi:cytochrome c biogenesis protein CcmG/thiol:disulfide interchange protein DsbE